MVAIITSGAKQYCVTPGQKVTVNRITAPVGEVLQFEDSLGGPKVAAEVLEHTYAPKVIIRKFRNKVRSHKMKGHRQPLTVLLITSEAEAPKKAPVRKKKEA